MSDEQNQTGLRGDVPALDFSESADVQAEQEETQPAQARVTSGKRVELRQVWPHEEDHFTPWLAENIQSLGEAIGAELEVQAQERFVGAFRSDIVAKDLRTNQLVVVENQVERTDHSHLGQALTYAAGVGAAVVVWVASRFMPEHMRALSWLNDLAGGKVQFLGVEVAAWRASGSVYVATFTLVCSPSDAMTSFRSRRPGRPHALLPAPSGKYGLYRGELARLLAENPKVSVGDVAKHFQVSKSTAHEWVKRLRSLDGLVELEEENNDNE